jgi:hypothetical protein
MEVWKYGSMGVWDLKGHSGLIFFSNKKELLMDALFL